jgi:cell division protein FtsL
MAMAQPQYDDRPRIPNPRTARSATATRIVKKQRARYGSVLRVGVALGCVVAALLVYVMLTSNVTSLTYAVAKAHAQRDQLVEETTRLDDKISTLRSQERLASIASKLKMRDAQQFVVVQLDPSQQQLASSAHVPVFETIAGWFGARPHPRVH